MSIKGLLAYNMVPVNFRSYFLWLILLSCSWMALSGCEVKEEKEVIEKFGTGEKRPLEVGHDVELIYSDSGYVKARVLAPLLERYEGTEQKGPYLEMKKGLRAFFYDKAFEVTSSLKANYGIRYEKNEKTELKGDVVVVNVEGDSLITEHLTWDENKQKIFSEDFVRVKTEDEIIYAQGFESNLHFTEYEFYDIKGTVSLHEEEGADGKPNK